VSGTHAHRQFQILLVDGKMGNFPSATFHVADSGVFSDEMKDIILSENSLKMAPPVVTEPDTHTHTHSRKTVLCVSSNLRLCAPSKVKQPFFLGSASGLFQLFFCQPLR